MGKRFCPYLGMSQYFVHTEDEPILQQHIVETNFEKKEFTENQTRLNSHDCSMFEEEEEIDKNKHSLLVKRKPLKSYANKAFKPAT